MLVVSLGFLGFFFIIELIYKFFFFVILKSWVFCVFLFLDKLDFLVGIFCVFDIRSFSLILFWYGFSYDGGSVVQFYSVEIWDSVDKIWKELVICRSIFFNVQDLFFDREYKFRVRVVNVYGISESSQEFEFIVVGEKFEGRLVFFYFWFEMNVYDLFCVCRNLC